MIESARNKASVSLDVFDGGRDYPSGTSRGGCPEPKHLSMSFNLNQISIFMSGRCKHWVRNQYNLKCSGCILAQMGLCPDTLKLPQKAFRGFLFTLCCASHRACQKIVQPAFISFCDCHRRSLSVCAQRTKRDIETLGVWEQERGT